MRHAQVVSRLWSDIGQFSCLPTINLEGRLVEETTPSPRREHLLGVLGIGSIHTV